MTTRKELLCILEENQRAIERLELVEARIAQD